jgi:ATP-binding cassette subfamily B protein
LLILGALGFLFREDWRVGVALTAFAGLALGVLLRLRDVGVQDSEAERQATAKMFGFLEERLAGLDDIRANGSGPYTVQRFLERIGEFYRAGRRAFKARTIVWRTTILFFSLGQLLALTIGAWLYLKGVVTLGTAYLLYHYTQMLFDPLEHIAHQIQDLQKAAASITRTREILSKSPSIQDGTRQDLAQGALPLGFAGVSFGYGEGDPVLQDISFQLQPGTTLGLLGRTGSGKTTLTRLIFRLYEPCAGVIYLDGQDLASVELQCLRDRVAMVTQEVQLFQASVRDNLTFFEEQVDDAQIIAALHDLGLGEWFERLPDGLDTELLSGARGMSAAGVSSAGVSAGEAQLLAFARAFLGDPGLVVLDEPSSRLDPATEHLLEKAMSRLLRGRTGIIIAHRLATVQRVDEIMIMSEGHILEHGPRQTLASDPRSHFCQLLSAGLEEAIA